jgi:hypothetical protein
LNRLADWQRLFGFHRLGMESAPNTILVQQDSGLVTNIEILIRKAQEMIIESLFGLSLALNVSALKVSLDNPPSEARTAWLHMTVPQRDAALLPLVQHATECIVREVAANPRYSPDLIPELINDLIVKSIPACKDAVRTMMRAHDRMYGSGSGEAFLLGPYLDVLPAAVVQRVRMKEP